MRLLAVAAAVVLLAVAAQASCPCADKTLCAPINTTYPTQAVYAFQTNVSNWINYDWSRLTTVALFNGYTTEMMCEAHKHGVRIDLPASTVSKYPNISDPTAVAAFVEKLVDRVVETYADGVNIDFENPIDKSDTKMQADLTAFVKAVRDGLKKKNPGYMVSFDVAWSPNHIDGRYYQYLEIINACDFVIIMDYDTRSQVFTGPPCYAGPNAPVVTAYNGTWDYIGVGGAAPGNNPQKFMLGQPWYGYKYTCTNSIKEDDTTTPCEIKSVPFRGVACSDAAGSQVPYSMIMEWFRGENSRYKATSGLVEDTEKGFATFNFVDNQDPGTVQRMYFDTPATLRVKYALAKNTKIRYGSEGKMTSLGMRGISMWNVDLLSTSKTGVAAQETAAMWSAMDAFLEDDAPTKKKAGHETAIGIACSVGGAVLLALGLLWLRNDPRGPFRSAKGSIDENTPLVN